MTYKAERCAEILTRFENQWMGIALRDIRKELMATTNSIRASEGSGKESGTLQRRRA